MDYEAMISALITLGIGIGSAVMKDDALTEEEKRAYLERIKASQDSVPEWK